MSMGSGNRAIFIYDDFEITDHLDKLKEAMKLFDEVDMSIDEVIERFEKFARDDPEITIEHYGHDREYESQMYLIIEEFCHEMKFTGFWIGRAYTHTRCMYNIFADQKLMSKIRVDV